MKRKIIGILVCMTLMLPALSVTAIANEPPSAPLIYGPCLGYAGVEYEYAFNSTDPNGDDVTYWIEWGDGSVEEWIGPFPSGVFIILLHSWNEQGDYTIQAKAKDIHDAESFWSTLEIVIENNPPNTPIIDGPTSGAAGVEYCWTFQSEDPNGDDIMYIIDWGDGSTTETDCYPSGTPVEECHTYTEPGVYSIKVKAKECPDGLESDWGTLTVTMPRNRVTYNTLFLRLFERFPNAFPLLRYILGL